MVQHIISIAGTPQPPPWQCETAGQVAAQHLATPHFAGSAPQHSFVEIDKVRLRLEGIPLPSRDQAVSALQERDVVGFLLMAPNKLRLVQENYFILRRLGLYEEALLHAFVNTRRNNSGWTLRALKQVFGEWADRERLRAAGDPLPGPGPFTIYRGVAGTGHQRRIRGLSWTSLLDKAWWFAKRSGNWCDSSIPDPGVYRVELDERDVFAYTNGREEQEFITIIPAHVRPVRVDTFGHPIQTLLSRVHSGRGESRAATNSRSTSRR